MRTAATVPLDEAVELATGEATGASVTMGGSEETMPGESVPLIMGGSDETIPGGSVALIIGGSDLTMSGGAVAFVDEAGGSKTPATPCRIPLDAAKSPNATATSPMIAVPFVLLTV
jgi:hypothetical protein